MKWFKVIFKMKTGDTIEWHVKALSSEEAIKQAKSDFIAEVLDEDLAYTCSEAEEMAE